MCACVLATEGGVWAGCIWVSSWVMDGTHSHGLNQMPVCPVLPACLSPQHTHSVPRGVSGPAACTPHVRLFAPPAHLSVHLLLHPSPSALEPQVVVCHQQQLLALANCAAPAPSSIIKVYSTHPAPLVSKPHHPAAAARDAPAAAAADPQAAAAAAAAVSVVGDSSRPGCVGALLLRELPVNAASDVKLVGGLLLAASSFHARGVSANSPFKSERAYTVVISIWETKTWQLTRLMSPR